MKLIGNHHRPFRRTQDPAPSHHDRNSTAQVGGRIPDLDSTALRPPFVGD
jgi:hypothetical protein